MHGFSWLRSFAARGLKSAVIWSFVSTGIRFGGVIVVLPVVVRHLSSEQLGIWYVFLAIGNMGGLLDLGFSQTVSRSVGYIWAGAKELKPLGIQLEDALGEREPNRSLLSTLVRTMSLYYKALALLVLGLMVSIGSWWIWRETAFMEQPFFLRGCWVLFAIGVALNTMGGLWPALLTGINCVQQGQRILILSLILNYLTTTVGLFVNLNLLAVVAGQLLGAGVLRFSGRYLFLAKSGLLGELKTGQRDLRLLQTLWPMAWRTGVNSMAVYISIHANTLIVNSFTGLAGTASYGLTLQLVLAISSVSVTWVYVKFPLITQLRSRGEHAQIAGLFQQRLLLTLATFLVGSAVLALFGRNMLELIGARTTLLPSRAMYLLLFAGLLDMITSLHTGLVLTENQNPFLVSGLLTGLGICALSMVLTPWFGIEGAVISWLAVPSFFLNWHVIKRAAEGLKINVPCYLKQFVHAWS